MGAGQRLRLDDGVHGVRCAAYVSAQVHALRFHSPTTGQLRDHWGSRMGTEKRQGVPEPLCRADRSHPSTGSPPPLRDSGRPPDPDGPRSSACGPPGQNLFCVGDLEGAVLEESWNRSEARRNRSRLSHTRADDHRRSSVGADARNRHHSGLPTSTPTPLVVALSSTWRKAATSTSSGQSSDYGTLSVTIGRGHGPQLRLLLPRPGRRATCRRICIRVTSATRP